MAHEYNSNNYVSFLLSSAGLNTVGVVSTIGVPIPVNGGGVLKASTDGNKLAFILAPVGVELYDFNRSNGFLSNALLLNDTTISSGGELSADGSKLYTNTLGNQGSYLMQWDLCAGSPTAILASRDTVGISTNSITGVMQYMQLAQNGRIYISQGSGYLGVISDPETSGSGCNYVSNAYNYTPNIVLGLPDFESHLLRGKFNYTAANSCATATFNVPSPGCKTNGVYNWNFGDPASGAANTSTLSNPVHQFSAGGTYTVKLASSFNNSCAPDTLIRVISIASSPSITLSGKLNFCKNESSVITAGGASTYTWNSGSNSSSIAVNNSSPLVYTVSATFSNNCISSRVFSVNLLNCTGLNEITDQPIKVYPNPIGEALFIETEHPVKILLYDAIGRIVLQRTLSQGKQTINTEHFAPGIYFLRMEKENEVQVLRLVKE